MLPLRPKSIDALRLGHQDPVEMTIYEGAIRSAKTFTSLLDWDDYVLHCPEKTFLMSGNTLGSLSRNCLDDPDFGFLAITGGAAKQRTDRDQSHYLEYHGKRIYLMGANDAGSFRKARGLTIGGWYADEINLQDKTFVATALGRSIASKLIRNIGTLNPDVPTHWFYADKGIGIDRWGKDYVPKLYRRFHFTLDDNPAITDERKARLAASYSGVFYKRYILGLRVRGEGGCYPSFVHNKPGEKGNVLDQYPKKIYRVTIGIDFGGSRSATAFSATGWYIDEADHRTRIVTLDELYDQENKSVESVMRNWKTFYTRIASQWPIDRVFADSEEQLIIKSMNGMGLPVRVENAMKRPTNDRIRLYDVLFSQGRASIMRQCHHTIEAFENAVWNEKSVGKDERLDNGSTNIDSLDAAEYTSERDASMLLENMR